MSTKLSDLRKALLANGYWPLPGLDKGCKLKGWSKAFLEDEAARYGSLPAAIDTWEIRMPNRRTTNVLVRDGLVVIDGDVNDKGLAAALREIIKEVTPEVWATAPLRFGSGAYKSAWFCRCAAGTEPFVRAGTHKYARPDELVAWVADETRKPSYHHVEIFGGALNKGKATRQFGAFGPHTVKPEILYRWEEEVGTLEDTPLAALPEITMAQVWEIARRFEEAAAALGWEQLPGSGGDESEGQVLFDIDREKTRFETSEHEWIDYAELSSRVGAGGEDVRLWATFIPGEGKLTESPDRCQAILSDKYRCVMVYDHKLRNTHLPTDAQSDPGLRAVTEMMRAIERKIPQKAASAFSAEISRRDDRPFDPPDRPADSSTVEVPSEIPQKDRPVVSSAADDLSDFDMLVDPLKSAEGTPDQSPGATAPESEPPEPEYSASMEDKVTWLLETRGYFEAEDSVVQIWATDIACRVKPTAFARRFAAWYHIVRKGRSDVEEYATDLWEKMPIRRHIHGVRMRPDMGFPLYSEFGQLFKNTYRRPVHAAAGGTIEPFLRFMERFLPDATEREWLFQWMAHKWLYPDVPGTAVVFIADSEGIREGVFGTGRGLLFKIVRKLYGESYVRAQDFNMLDGSSGQSTFNDWLHGSVLVTIDESKTSATAYRRGERSATYEILKNLVDPDAKQFSFKGKYRQAFDGISYASFMIASNHADVLAIPAGDRRFSALRNGRKMTPEEAIEIVTWMSDLANIAALARFLAARDLSSFNMREPLITEAKHEMAELSLSSVDEVLRDLMEDEKCGKVFIKKHLEKAVSHYFNESSTYWVGEFREAWPRYCASVKGDTTSTRRISSGGKQQKLFAFRTRLAEANSMPVAALRREAAKWGQIDGAKSQPGTIWGVGTSDGTSEKDE